MKLQLAASCAVLFGTLYTVFRKYQCVVDLQGTQQQFNQPMFQAFLIFTGMTTIYFFRPFIPKQEQKADKKPQSKFIYFLPSFLDVVGTILDTTGLFYTSVSVSQMLKGAALFFTYLITISCGTKKLTNVQHFWMISIVFSLSTIGYSNLSSPHMRYQANPLLGNSLIILSQFIFALMFIVQQRITKSYNIQVSTAVLWQGLWGMLISAVFLFLFTQFKTQIIQCDVFQSCSLILKNKKLLGSVIITALCIAPFNYFGLMITKDTSALQRCLVCTSRMIVVWMISLIFDWQKFSFLQLIGYLGLTYAIYKFNQEQNNESVSIINEQQQSMKIKKINSDQTQGSITTIQSDNNDEIYDKFQTCTSIVTQDCIDNQRIQEKMENFR